MSELVGVDLGGTKVAAARMNGRHLDETLIEPTNRSNAAALVDQLVELVGRVRSAKVSPVIGCRRSSSSTPDASSCRSTCRWTNCCCASSSAPSWEAPVVSRGRAGVGGRIVNAIDVVIGGGALGAVLLAIHRQEKS